MTIQEIIDKKRKCEKLTKEEINFFVNGYTNGTIKDYEASALLMAIAINGMDIDETTALTLSMRDSGEIIDLSKIEGIKADKHSTGGISDTTTLAVLPILASLGIKMAKMSGRSLGFTGGTIDKLEAIKGFNVNLSGEEFIDNVNKIGACIIGQTQNIAPADKKLYALRDVTSTVESIPLIASSVMSKKLASGADIILLDVKYGSGAFMKTAKKAEELAETMVNIGKKCGKKMCAIISSMEQPLGTGIGCNMEVVDAVNVLKGENNRLSEVVKVICYNILMLAKNITKDSAKKLVEQTISSGKALEKFIEIVKAQGGDVKLIKDTTKFKKPKKVTEYKANKNGYINKIIGENLGNAVRLMGGGRLEKDQEILHEVGIRLKKGLGDKVQKGETIAIIEHNKDISEITKILDESILIGKKMPVPKLIYKTIV